MIYNNRARNVIYNSIFINEINEIVIVALVTELLFHPLVLVHLLRCKNLPSYLQCSLYRVGSDENASNYSSKHNEFRASRLKSVIHRLLHDQSSVIAG